MGISYSQKIYMYVGSYSAEDGTGIYVLQLDTLTGHLSEVLRSYKVENPSFLAISKNKKYLYAISELSSGLVTSFKVHPKTGELTILNSQPTLGSGPCHIACDFKDKWCLVGHYGSGDISLLPIKADGKLGKPSLAYKYNANNGNTDIIPRVHSINIANNNTDVYVPDLGLDQILQFNLKAGNLVKRKNAQITLPKGSGPRHFAFHPNGKWAYCISEYASKIHNYNIEKDGLAETDNITTLPNGFSGKNYCADIHVSPDGRFVYGSNRGHNSIAIFGIEQQTGKLIPLRYQSTLGDFPRNFVIDPSGSFLLVANQKSNDIQVFRRDKKTGLLSHVRGLKNINKPVCLKFL